MFSNQVQQRVRGLVAGIGTSIITNPDLLETKLADLAANNPDDVKLIVSAARSGIPEEIASAAQEHRAEMVQQAAAWMASETGASPEAAKWAVETWAKALEGVNIAPQPAAPQPTVLSPPPLTPSGPAYGAGVPPAPWDTPRAPQQGSWGAPPGAGPGQGPGYGAPPPGAWPPPPGYPGSYGSQNSWANTSGTQGAMPPQIAKLKWNWGAFGVSFWWLIFHGWWPLALGLIALNAGIGFLPGGYWVRLCVAYGVQIVLGLLGNRLAWQNRSYESIEHFFDVERVWMVWGITLSILSLTATIGILFLLGVFAHTIAGR